MLPCFGCICINSPSAHSICIRCRLKFQGESDREQEWGETTVVYVALNMHAGVYLWVHARWSICVGVHSIVVGDYNTKNPNSQIKSRSM